MIKARRTRRRLSSTPSHQVWAEANKKGGYIIYCGIKGTEKKTIAGGAANLESLDYNLRKARHKFGLSI
tara:strand:- start:178 stop:384 length:207 start_codon:yes stop_codon:yes gene_type:complete